MSYYLEGAPGEHFCRSEDPIFNCPIGDCWDYRRGHEIKEHVRPQMEAAAAALDVDPVKLASKLKHSADRERVNGRLTDNCKVCGHRLRRLGFAVWHEQLLDPAVDDLNTGEQISYRLNGSAFRRVRSRYVKTKREAGEWMSHEAERSRTGRRR